MRRSIFAVILILCIVCLGWHYENTLLEKMYFECTSRLDAFSSASEFPAAPEYLGEYLSAYESYRRVLAIIVPHTDTDELTLHNALLSLSAQSHDREKAREEILELKCIYRNIKDKFDVNYETIL